MCSLVLHFRNGPDLVRRMRRGECCDEIVFWDGTRVAHPPEQGGLLEAAIELCLDHVYTSDFYDPGDGDVIVDVGANVGVFAIEMARRNRNYRVMALEPHPGNFKYLQTNTHNAKLKNLTCLEAALGSDYGSGRMQAGSRSLDHVLRVEPAATNGIKIIPLSALFELAGGEIDFLKIDIEGSEADVFAAASPDCLRRIKRIAMEYHDNIRPGTLEILKSSLTATHEVTVHPSKLDGCGILKASRRGNNA
jgi:FkbM family methyltransferase